MHTLNTKIEADEGGKESNGLRGMRDLRAVMNETEKN